MIVNFLLGYYSSQTSRVSRVHLAIHLLGPFLVPQISFKDIIHKLQLRITMDHTCFKQKPSGSLFLQPTVRSILPSRVVRTSLSFESNYFIQKT